MQFDFATEIIMYNCCKYKLAFKLKGHSNLLFVWTCANVAGICPSDKARDVRKYFLSPPWKYYSFMSQNLLSNLLFMFDRPQHGNSLFQKVVLAKTFSEFLNKLLQYLGVRRIGLSSTEKSRANEIGNVRTRFSLGRHHKKSHFALVRSTFFKKLHLDPCWILL